MEKINKVESSTWSIEKKEIDKLLDDKVNKKIYEEYYNKLSDKNKEIFSSIEKTDFLKNKDFSFLLATLLFLEKKWEKFWSKINKYVKKKPVLIEKFINWFKKEAKDLISNEEKEDKLEEKEDKLNTKLDVNNNLIYQLSEKLKWRINEIKDPKFKKEVKQKIQIKESEYIQAWLSPDKAYLASFSDIYNSNKELQKTISLNEEDKAVLNNVKEEVRNLWLEKIVWWKEISWEINNFSNQETEYDDKIKESLNISWLENMEISLDKQKYLSWKYKKLVETMFNQIEQKNKWITKEQLDKDYTKYLNGEKTKEDKVFVVVWNKLLNYEIKQSTNGFVQEYKQIAMKEYTKSIFDMFDKSVWTENITKNFGKTDKFDIEKDGQIKLNFKYKQTPLDFKISANGQISMTDYVWRDGIKKDSWAFQKKETKLNDFFNIVSVKEILEPEKINFKDIVKEKDIKWSLQNQIKEQIQNKIAQNNVLWNKELMKTETKYEMERQSITHKMLWLYQPPEKVKKYISGGNIKISEQDRWLFYFLWRIDKTLRTDENAQNILEATLADEKFNSIFQSLHYNEKIKTWEENTYDIFKKLKFIGVNWNLNTKNIEKFKKKLDKVSSAKDCWNLPQIEWYTWNYENWKVKLEEKGEEKDNLFDQLDEKFSNYKKIDIK